MLIDPSSNPFNPELRLFNLSFQLFLMIFHYCIYYSQLKLQFKNVNMKIRVNRIEQLLHPRSQDDSVTSTILTQDNQSLHKIIN